MVDRRRELILEEDARWADLHAALHGVPHERLEEPGVTDLWSSKDLLAHLGCWMAEAANQLEQMRMGTYESRKLDLDAMNAEFYEATRDQSLRDVWAEMEAARTRMFQEWSALSEITRDAEEWFVESGPAHVAEHLPQLLAFLGRGTPEPRI
jgi:hypothetical protein